MAEENDRILRVSLTMDCLPAGGGPDVRGPERWDHAERAIHGFADALVREDLRATFLVAPGALRRLGGVIEELRGAGFELGLLCHPQLCGYQACLGSYNFDRQREIIRVERETWEEVLGEPAETFRPGFFSANDYTYHVLCLEGFRQGSCSLPGRCDGEQCSMWFQSYPYPHHTDPLDRLAEGSMEFFEVPLTSDFEAASQMTYETYTPPHLRIEEPDLNSYAEPLARRQVERMHHERVRLPVLTLVTSNVVDWGGEDDPHCERLHNLCQMLRDVAARRGERLGWAGLESLHREWDELMGGGPPLADQIQPMASA